MSFISILIALLLEQARPLAPANPVHNFHRAWVQWAVRNFDVGGQQHGWLAWVVTVLVPTGVACLIHWVLVLSVGWMAAAAWSVAVIYLTLGFRQFSHHFTRIRDALYAGDETLARQYLIEWMQLDVTALPRREIVRHVIEYSVVSAHRHVFGVLAWYSVGAAIGLGPAGAVAYRMAEYTGRFVSRTARPDVLPVSAALQAYARRAWYYIDWIPVRLTALGFAFVGSFEDAVDCWRQYAAQFPLNNDGVVIAATAGAVKVQLGDAESFNESGEVPQSQHLRAVVGLVWRTVVMWMVVLALLTLARLIG
jgi:adenosylcobinamide-phosphate synthase